MVGQIVFFSLVVGFFLLLRKNEHYFVDFYYNRIKWHTRISADQYYRYTKFLEEELPYFRRLSPDGKAKFVHRLKKVISTKNFEGMYGLQVTNKMRVLISAVIVQLTYGLKHFDISHFTVIRIYAEQFYSGLYEQHLKGGASKRGVLSLSWKDFLEGIADENDKYNLGLHEIAHALKINVTEGSDFDMRFSSYLDRWLEIGSKEFSKMKHAQESFLRKYAGTNMHEFFAVCVEHFFEAPEDFKKHLPNIYNHLCVLLNQDPLNPRNDYQLSESFKAEVNRDRRLIPIPDKVQLSLKYVNWHWSHTIMITGPIVFFPLSLFFNHETMLPDGDFLKLYIIAFAIAFITQFKWLTKADLITKKFFPVYAIMGFSPALVTLTLFLNSTITLKEYEEAHDIRSYNYDGYELYLRLEDGEYSEREDLRTFNYHIPQGQKPVQIVYTVEEGVMGYKTVDGWYLILREK